MRISEFIIIFFFYGFIGWCWESFLCSSVEYDGVLNRGFFLGPYCPIYGIGAILSYLALKNIDSNLFIFIYSATICCSVEYVIGYVLERFFHQRWWDYKDYPFQIHRRVCLYGMIIFGSANILIVKHITPMLLFFLEVADNDIIHALAVSISMIFVMDSLVTVNKLLNGFDILIRVYDYFGEKNERYFNYINESDRLMNLKMMAEQRDIKGKFESFNENLKVREENMKKLNYEKIKNLFYDN
ncbi:putative ABC transporter permease [Peptoniphilus sp. MSJ-1]|uniref:ABC transporter permease n=1 Tax=Peptoniphilus ovalis TaxID=2841503 RepID=A0ABS6FIC9_9FIRM|nr:putative ABC transporter permease [Peptoniphilus ovalis]MBU5669914.1 putative ABC transporter permease [Peptoniphilus ovalis]